MIEVRDAVKRFDGFAALDGATLTVLLLVALTGGGAVCYLKFFKKKPDTRGSADLDDYDYGEAEEDEVMESDSEEQPEDV